MRRAPAVLELREEATPGGVTLLVDLWCVADLTLLQFRYTSLRLSTLACGLHCYCYLQYVKCQRDSFVNGEQLGSLTRFAR